MVKRSQVFCVVMPTGYNGSMSLGKVIDRPYPDAAQAVRPAEILGVNQSASAGAKAEVVLSSPPAPGTGLADAARREESARREPACGCSARCGRGDNAALVSAHRLEEKLSGREPSEAWNRTGPRDTVAPVLKRDTLAVVWREQIITN